jgi:hypothetical protein
MPKPFKVPVKAVLKGAKEAELARVFVVGKYKNGRLFAAGSAASDRHLEDIEEFLYKFESGEYDADGKS